MLWDIRLGVFASLGFDVAETKQVGRSGYLGFNDKVCVYGDEALLRGREQEEMRERREIVQKVWGWWDILECFSFRLHFFLLHYFWWQTGVGI